MEEEEESPLPLPPSSPGVEPVELKDCVEELLKFTLISSIQGKIQIGLSNEYCADLLRDDPSAPLHTNAVSGGVPSYPLYKRLASSLYQSICSGALCTSYKELIPSDEELNHRKKDEEWNKMIVEKGSALLSVLREVNFELHVQEPFFSLLSDGVKTIEGRCAVGDYKRIRAGHVLLVNKCLTLQVQDVRKYSSFCEMLEVESLASVLPGVTNIEEGVQTYRNFYSEEKERSNGVLAIHVRTPTSQLRVITASIVSGLSYGGVQKLLGFVETAGTNPELLPPPTSTLLSTFSSPHNPDFKGSMLTNGARALAKHVNRSCEGYWGPLHGSDKEKNRHAVETISRLLAHCSWMNMHIVRPHGSVFEIRNDDGYGARWSVDGTKFIGFLEPYAIDGYSKGWKH
ncbi:uncharacterized protein LOC131022230 isoform X2 [Salvia miltiorrhiza]|uniref:uncharacterized protein LOC131022230 isoform X2 n=1 Tax=Salvia miltiorrhiza TaxID=226208 RepID=UPI0025AD7411|nr:uncharacterized protein LOC131022230 isoform X2 [Salvia miltiorrhiza]